MSTFKTAHLLLTLGSALAFGASCNPYDPNLGDTPFRCSEGDQKCPEGYRCLDFSPSEKICEKIVEDEVDGGPQTSGLTCNSDSALGVNDNRTQAFNTGVSERTASISLVAAICPNTDRDFFSLTVDGTGGNIIVNMQYLENFAPLSLKITSTTNETLATGSVQSQDNDSIFVSASVLNVPQGTYYVEVYSDSSDVRDENNYAIDITVE